MQTVYLDHAATTPADPRVVEAMRPYFNHYYGNAHSVHHKGREAKKAVEKARETIAQTIGARPGEIVFTSGGTESDNAAIKGVLEATERKQVVSSTLEHHAVLHTLEHEQKLGAQPKLIDPDGSGVVGLSQVRDALDEQTALVSLMHVNNEIGSISPLEKISAVCREAGVPLHTDAVQSLGKIPVNVDDLGVDLLSASGHKIYGPKGIGFLYIRQGTSWTSWMHGGAQEHNRRGGTLNVPGIVGMAEALRLIEEERSDYFGKFQKLRNSLLGRLKDEFEGSFEINGPGSLGVPHIINLAFSDSDGKPLEAEMLLMNLDMEGICVSSGSACSSGAIEPSHVLTGIGLNEMRSRSSIRISLGKDNTEEDMQRFVKALQNIHQRVA